MSFAIRHPSRDLYAATRTDWAPAGRDDVLTWPSAGDAFEFLAQYRHCFERGCSVVAFPPAVRLDVASALLSTPPGQFPAVPVAPAAPRNARFWTWGNGGWVKLTLRPGDSLTHHTYRTTDEGYSASETTWEHAGDHIRRVIYSRGRDCDGLVESEHAHVSPMSSLAADFAMSDPSITVPEWERVSATQRDHSAETAGY